MTHVTLGAGASAAAAVVKEDTAAAGQAMDKLWLSLEEAQKRLATRSADLQAERETTASLRRRVPVLLQTIVCEQAGSQLACSCMHCCQPHVKLSTHSAAPVLASQLGPSTLRWRSSGFIPFWRHHNALVYDVQRPAGALGRQTC